MGETKPDIDDRAPPPRDDLTACRVVIYAHVAILPLSLLATRLDSGLFGLPFETKQEVLGILFPPLFYGLYLSPIVTLLFLARLKHSSAEFRVGIFFLEVLLWFVQLNLMLPMVQ